MTAGQINNYLASGYSVIGIMGIDGSPSCGLNTTLDFEKSFELTASMDIESATVEQMNAIVRQGLTNGKGPFAEALQKELKKRHIDLHYVAHDLIAELDGQTSSIGALLSS
jgi:predicted secreted protein